jgi:hypothetical protein
MDFDPKYFFSFAETLLENDDLSNGDEEKVKFSTVVNRSYYAVYLRIRDILEKEHNEKPVKRGDHRRTRLGLVNNMGRWELKETYNTLWDERKEADYYMGENVKKGLDFKKFANDSKDSAEYLLKELKNNEPRNY